MKTKVMEVITYKKQTSKTKYIIEAALEYRPPLNISRNFFSEKVTASIQENTVNRYYQMLKINPTAKFKAKTLKHLNPLKVNKLNDNKLHYYLRPTDSSAPRFCGQPKIQKPGVSIRPIVSGRGSTLYNLNKFILIAHFKVKFNNRKNSTTFSN